MSKEKVNPGEICGFCGTNTAPGSVVCTGCQATRKREVYGFRRIPIFLLVLIAAILIPTAIVSKHYTWVYASLSVALWIVIVTMCYKLSEYRWVRPMPK